MVGRVFEGLHDERAEWMRHGACAGTDVDVFFIAPGEYPWAAIAMCSTCTVRQRCLDYAVVNNIEEGIWGGCTPRARRRLRVKR